MCRFLQDLPAGLSSFNDMCIATHHNDPVAMQRSKEKVREIVQQARQVAATPAAAPRGAGNGQVGAFNDHFNSLPIEGSFN
jgi:hypothetical protein